MALLPLFAVGSIYLEALLAARALGHWPVPSVEDPKHLSTAPFHIVSQLLVLAIYPGAIFFTAVLLKNWRVLREPSGYWMCLLVFLFALGLYFVVGHSPTLSWWAD